METLKMSEKEINQIRVFEDLAVKKLKQKEAAKILGLSVRQIKRKVKKYKRNGAASLIHGGRGRAGNHTLDLVLVKSALAIVATEYPDFGPTLAAEKLLEYHHLKMNPETLRLQMIQEGIWKLKQQKRPEIHVWRERKANQGELIQLDGSPHAWFEDRAPKCTLLAFIDDATSNVLWAQFAKSESTKSLMDSTRNYLEIYGKPISLYPDRGGVYKVNVNNPDGEKLTQYGRALGELGIELIYARSPQAKGRVERLFGTLQDRLVKEMRLKGISTIDEANKFLKEEYLAIHNTKFAVTPRDPADLHTSIVNYNLDDIFCLKAERKVNNDFTISYLSRWLQLEAKQPTILRPKTIVEVWESLEGKLTLHLRGLKLNSKELPQRPEKIVVLKERKERMVYIPPANHPWRQSREVLKSDISILQKGDISILV